MFLYLIYRIEFLERAGREERTELLDRLMSRNMDEFKYYTKKYPGDVKTMQGAISGAKDVEVRPELSAKAKEWLKGLDSEFSPDEIDVEELEKIVAEEERSDFAKAEEEAKR